MKAYLVPALVITFTATLVQGKLGLPGGPQKLLYDAIDVFKVFETFDSVVVISDSDNDANLECLSARRTDFNPETRTASYVWILPSIGKEIQFSAEIGDTPGTITFTSPEHPETKEAIIYYTDYKNCIVADVEFHGHQCSLWTKKEVKDSVPQDCIDRFADTCDVVVPPHSRDLCEDSEGDY